MNLNCACVILEDRILLILFAISLEILFYTILHKEIGLQSEKEEGLDILGMKEMKVALMAPEIRPHFFKKSEWTVPLATHQA